MDECTGESGEQYQQAREQYQLHDFLDLVVATLRKFTCKFKVLLSTYSILFVLLIEFSCISHTTYKVINTVMREMRVNIVRCSTL